MGMTSIVAIFLCTLLYQGNIAHAKEAGDYVSNLLENEELNAWEPSEEFQKNYPYYWSGYDEDGRPVWISELGKWDVRRAAEAAGGERAKTFQKYVDQLAGRLARSANDSLGADGRPINEFVVIVDMDNYDLAQIASLPTVSLILKVFQQIEPVLRKIQAGYIINANFVAERIISLVRPVLGSVFENIEVYGTSKAKWLADLSKHITEENLPPWYGGSKGFAPVKIYG